MKPPTNLRHRKSPKDPPTWSERLRERYLSGETSCFLLHGNIADYVRDQRGSFLPFDRFLQALLRPTKEIIIQVDPAKGLWFADTAMQALFEATLDVAARARPPTGALSARPSGTRAPLALIDLFLKQAPPPTAVIIHFAEIVAPEADIPLMSEEDRAALVTLLRWADDPHVVGSDVIVLMTAENVTEVNRRIRSAPRIAQIEVGLPDETLRRRFARSLKAAVPPFGMSATTLARLSSGLRLVQIEGIVKRAVETGRTLRPGDLRVEKRRIISQECRGLVELVAPTRRFSHLGGHREAAERLKALAAALRSGRTRTVPMGVLLTGPMGTGKTAMAEAFARESGFTCMRLATFRDKWVGATEANLERILKITEALGQVVLIIDEADRTLGDGAGGAERDGGTSSRVMARLKEFFSDTTHRGNILVMLLTNRPDRLDEDMKRSGRFDLKIPLFAPAASQERRDILRALARRHGIRLSLGNAGALLDGTEGYTGADLEALLLAAAELADERGKAGPGPSELEAALRDYLPGGDRTAIEFMELLAARESSSRALLPRAYRHLSPEAVEGRLAQLRTKLSRRGW